MAEILEQAALSLKSAPFHSNILGGGTGEIGAYSGENNQVLSYKDITIDKEEAFRLLQVYDNDAEHANALALKLRSLYSERLQVEEILSNSLKEGKPPIDLLNEIIHDYYTPTSQCAFASCYALGYVGTSIVAEKDPKYENRLIMVPQVSPRETYDVVARSWSNGKIEYFAKEKGQNKPSERIFLFFMSGYTKPDPITGKHHSPIKPTLVKSDFMQQLFKFQVEACRQMSHPPFVIEEAPKTNEVSALAPINMGGANSLLLANAKAENQRLSNQQISEKAIINALTSTNNDDPLITNFSGDGEEPRKKFKMTVVDNMHYIPKGYKAAQPQPPMPTTMKEIMDYNAEYKDSVYNSHGIPPAMLVTGSRNNTNTTSMADDKDTDYYQRTLQHDRTMICKYCEKCYLESYPDLNRKSDLNFKLIFVPFVYASQIQRLYEQDIIHPKAHKKIMGALHGLEDHDLATEPNEITRPPINGNENQTTAGMKAISKQRDEDAHEHFESAEKLKAERKLLEQQLRGEGLEFEKLKNQKEIEELKIKQEEIKIQAMIEKVNADGKQLEIDKERADLEIKTATEKLAIDEKKATLKQKSKSNNSD